MALNVGELYAKVKLDLKDFNKGIKDIQKSLQQLAGNNSFGTFGTKAVNAITRIANANAKLHKQINDNLKIQLALALANMSKEEAAAQRKHQLKLAHIQREIALRGQQTQLAIALTKKETETIKSENAKQAQADKNLTNERIANIRAWERVSSAAIRATSQNYATSSRNILNIERNRINEIRRLEQQAYQQRRAELQQLGTFVGAGYFTGALQGNLFQTLFNTFSVSSILSALKSIFDFTLQGIQAVSAAIYRFTEEAISYNAKLEMSFEQLKYIIGSDIRKELQAVAGATEDIVVPMERVNRETLQIREQLKQLSIESPTLKFEDVMQGATRLANAGVPIEDLVEIVKALGDGAATTGADAVRNFDRVTYAVGQMYQKGGIYAEEFRKQLGNTGIPTIEALAAVTGKSVNEISKSMDDGQLKSREWVDAYIDGLKMVRGGAMEELADTFSGQINIMSEKWKFFTSDITKPLFETLKNQIAAGLRMIENEFADSAFVTNVKNLFSNIGIAISSIVTNLLPPLLLGFEELSNKMNSGSVDFFLEFNDAIVKLGEKIPTLMGYIGGFFSGVIEIFKSIFSDLPQIIETAMGIFAQLPAILVGVYDAIMFVINAFLTFGTVFSFQWLTGDAATLTDQLEVLAQTIIMLTTVFVTLKAVMAAVTLVFFLKQLAIGRASYEALTLAATGNTAAINANAAAQLRQQAASIRAQIEIVKEAIMVEALSGSIKRETAVRIANAVATGMEANAAAVDAAAQNADTLATNANTASKGNLTKANLVAAGSFRTLLTAMGPVGIAITILSVIATALIPAFIDFGDAGEEAGEQTEDAFKRAEKQAKDTQKTIDKGFVDKNIQINVKSDVKNIDFSKLPNYNSDGTIQGPDMVVRVITTEEVEKEREKLISEADEKRIKQLQKEISNITNQIRAQTGRAAAAAGITPLSASVVANLQRQIQQKEAEIAQIKGNRVQAGAANYEVEAEKAIKNIPAGRALYETAFTGQTGAGGLPILTGLMTQADYERIRDEIIILQSKGQKGLDKIAEELIRGTRNGIAAGEKFKEEMYGTLRENYYKQSNIGQILQELKREGFFNKNIAAYSQIVKEAVYGANPKDLRDAIEKVSVNARDAFVRRVEMFDKEAFTREYSDESMFGAGGSGTETPEDVPDFTGGGGTKPLSPYEKKKREAEHLKAMGKSAEVIYTKWLEAQKVAYLEVDYDEGLANFRESEEKKLELTKDIQERITDAIESEQKKQEDSIENTYKQRKKVLDDYYKKINNEEDKQTLEQEKRALEIERKFYERATSAIGISKLAEVDKKIRDKQKEIEQFNRDRQQEMDEDALEKAKDSALERVEKESEENISAIEKTKMAIKQTIEEYVKALQVFKQDFYTEGKNAALEFQKGFSSVTGRATDVVMSAASQLTNPSGRIMDNVTTNVFNAPILTIQNANFGDKVDVQAFSQELWRTAQRATTATGGRM